MNDSQWQQLIQGKSGLEYLKSYGNVALGSDSNGNVYWVSPTGEKLDQVMLPGIGYARADMVRSNSYDNELANGAVKLASFVNSNYVKNPDGSWRGATYGGDGADYKTAITANPTTKPTTTSVTQPSSTTTMTTAPSTTQGGMPSGYKVTGQEPSGWATGPDGHMIKITDIPGGATSPTGTVTTANGSTITGDPAGQRAALQAAGIDANLLTDSQVSALYLMHSYTESQAQKDKQIAPASLSQADMDKFLSDAKAEYDPYYQGQFDIAKNSLLQAVGQISGDNSYLEQQNATNFQMQNEQAAKQAAQAGLARSGIRQLAEQRLAEQQSGLVQSGRRKAQNDIYNLGSKFEENFGSSGLAKAGGAPSIQSAGNAALGIAPTTIGYNPIGVAGGGAQGAAQTTATIQEQQRLAQLEASKRLNNAYGSTATNLP